MFLLAGIHSFSQKQKLTILGSSTAEGLGASEKDSSWVGRLKHYFQTVDPVIDTVFNLARRGKDPYFAMPSSYIPPADRPFPNKDSNITRAVSLRGKFLIVSFSSNNYDVYSFSEIHSTLKTIKDSAEKAGLICYITSSQPRTEFTPEGRLKLKQVKDSILTWFGSRAINFFDPIVDPVDLSILPMYRYTQDEVHLNDLGHRVLFEQVLAKKIFDTSDIDTTVIPTPPKDWQIRVFPNPSKSDFSVVFRFSDIIYAETRLISSSGATIFRQRVVDNQQIRFGAELQAGLYFLVLQAGSKQQVKKILKQ